MPVVVKMKGLSGFAFTLKGGEGEGGGGKERGEGGGERGGGGRGEGGGGGGGRGGRGGGGGEEGGGGGGLGLGVRILESLRARQSSHYSHSFPLWDRSRVAPPVCSWFANFVRS